MRNLILTFFAISSLTVLGQNRKLPPYSKELVYAINLIDTTQRILVHIYTQDTCGNETSYCDFDYTDYLPFELQKEQSLTVKDKGFREYSYKTSCKPTIVRVLDKDKKLLKRFLYKYNGDNTLEELLIVDSNENQNSKFKYQYSKTGKLIKEIRYDSKNKADLVTNYYYKNDTISIETLIDLSDNDTLICHYTYNDRKQLIVEEWSSMDGSDKEFEFSIYSNSLKVKELFLDEEGKVREYRMTYYSNGLERTWKQVDSVTGDILDYEFHEYEF